MDRRTTLKWVLAAASAMAGPQSVYAAAGKGTHAYEHDHDDPIPDLPVKDGYGTDPNLTKIYKPGELWPLTLTGPQRETARVLSDLIIPADAVSPSASSVGVVDFIDEWISAPYKQQRTDRVSVLKLLKWLDKEAAKRNGPGSTFAALSEAKQTAICDDICLIAKAKPTHVEAARFFARYRDLTAGGFYSSPQGRQDVRYVGNVPLTHFDGPPLEVLKKAGLA